MEDVSGRSTGMRRSTSEGRRDKRGEREERIFVSLIHVTKKSCTFHGNIELASSSLGSSSTGSWGPATPSKG